MKFLRHFSNRNVSRPLPEFVSWSKEGVLTPVKNQRNTGLCAVISSVTAMESLVTIRSRESGLISVSDGPIELSNQYLVNLLAHKFWENNMRIVENGLPIFTILEFLQLNGIPLERDFPFKRFPFHRPPLPHCTKKLYHLDGFECIRNGEREMMEILVDHPIIAGVDATRWHSDEFWKKDIVHSSKPVVGLNHAVTITGYGQHKDIPYWEVRDTNSSGCGQGGYIKVRRGNNSFGIEKDVYYPIINPF